MSGEERGEVAGSQASRTTEGHSNWLSFGGISLESVSFDLQGPLFKDKAY